MQGKVTPSVARPTADPPTSMADYADAQSAQAVIAALTQSDQFGYRAAVSLCTEAIGQLQRIRATRPYNSVPLPTDVASGGGSGLLFRIVLRHITVRGFLHRCGGTPPEAARDPLKFSALFATQFNRIYVEPLHTMDAKRKYDCLYDFLKKKWSTDKKRKLMTPATDADWCRCEASWGKFYITDDELGVVCSEAVAAYDSRHRALCDLECHDPSACSI